MEIPALTFLKRGEDIWSHLIDLAVQLELEPDRVLDAIEHSGNKLIACAQWVQNEEWDERTHQAEQLLLCLEDTIEGCLCVLEDDDPETACSIWKEVRERVFKLEDDVSERGEGLFNLMAC